MASLKLETLTLRAHPDLTRFESAITAASQRSGAAISFRKCLARGSGNRGQWFLRPEAAMGVWPLRENPSLRMGRTALPALRWSLGRTPAGRPLWIQYQASVSRHLAVLGETGMGKSSLLVALALQAHKTANIVLVDPIGDTAQRLREKLTAKQLQEAVVFTPATREPTINALHPDASTCERQGTNLPDLVDALRRVRAQRYSDVPFWGPRIEDAVHRALAVVVAWPYGTLADASDLLEGRAPDLAFLPGDSADDARRIIRWAHDRPDEVDGARRLLAEVARHPDLRRVLCARNPTWSLDDVESPGRITIVSGEAPRVGESVARVFTTIVVALLWSRLLGRSPLRKLCLVLDEAQWYAHEGVTEALRVARRLNVHIWLATQSLESLSITVRDALETNVADWVLFRGGSDGVRWIRNLSRAGLEHSDLALGVGEALWVEGKGRSVELLQISAETASDRRVMIASLPTVSASSSGLSTREGSHDLPTATGECRAPASGENCHRAGGAAPSPPGDLRAYWSGVGQQGRPPGQGVRVLGGRLGREGLLLSTGRDERGRYWVVPASAAHLLDAAGMAWEPHRPGAGPAGASGRRSGSATVP